MTAEKCGGCICAGIFASSVKMSRSGGAAGQGTRHFDAAFPYLPLRLLPAGAFPAAGPRLCSARRWRKRPVFPEKAAVYAPECPCFLLKSRKIDFFVQKPLIFQTWHVSCIISGRAVLRHWPTVPPDGGHQLPCLKIAGTAGNSWVFSLSHITEPVSKVCYF